MDAISIFAQLEFK